MKMTFWAISAALIVSPVASVAQQTQDDGAEAANEISQSIDIDAAPEAATVAPEARTLVLPANSEVVLRMAEELSTKGGQVKEGQMFRMTVAFDVKVGGITVIPAGTPATGEVTWKTGRAVFGKSGKMQVALRHIDLDGDRIPVAGEYRQEGEGDTLAAVGAVLLAAPLMVITGKSAIIPRGKEMVAHTVEPFTATVS